ncbi:MAG: AI-2E family transporter [Alphaproteobacteria bacterium]|nr:AI-2E family transporter [Alphaproteobacteria bacterium]
MYSQSDPQKQNREVASTPRTSGQLVSRVVLAASLGLLGLWILHRFVAALAWAAIIAIALWPLYWRAERAFPPRGRRIWLPLAATLLVGGVLIVPLVYAAVQVAHESGSFVQYIQQLRHSGLPAPDWLSRVPAIGPPFAEWWKGNLSDPQTMRELLGRLFAHAPADVARVIGIEVIHRLVIFGFTLLTLFFLFRDGEALCGQLLVISQRILGSSGERVARHMIGAVHGTVTGLVLVGLAEGVVIGFAYAAAGLPHVVPLAALTGILAVIPFGAPIAFWGAGLYLLANGNTGAAIGVVGFGLLVVFVADHFIRPVLIGSAARLPFLWVLLGILGGVETFGLLGLFLGPVVMAALISLWRDWTGAAAVDDDALATAPRRSRPL